MPQRAVNLVLAVAGAAALVVLLAVGANVYRAARTGPRWKRRLVGAGLVLLAALGLAPAGCEQSAGNAEQTATTEGEAAQPGSDLAATREWKHLAAVWKEAEEINSGKRGDYPFDEAGKKKMLEDLKAVGADIDGLEKAALVSAAEAGLLRKDLAMVVKDVQARRPTELRNATCYKPMMVMPAADGLKRLKAQVPLLAQVAAGERVRREVIEKVLVRIERDIATLGSEKELSRLPEAEREAARETAEAAKAEVAKVRERLKAAGAARSSTTSAGERAGGRTDLAAAPEWQRLTATWREAEEVGAGRRGAYPFDEAGKKKMLEDLKAVGGYIDSLDALGDLSAAEAGILRKDLPRLVAGVQAKRPTEDRMATCYEPMMWQPARESLGRLSARLAVLEALAEAKAVRREVLYKVLGTIEADLAVLGNEQRVEGLKEAERAEAARVCEAAKAAVEKIRARAGGAATADLAESAGWKTIQAAWKVAEPLAESGKSTTAERKAADAALAKAETAARDLAVAGTISAAEAELIAARGEDLKADIYRGPPTDQMVTCYIRRAIVPAEASMERLRDRLPLLKRIVERGKVRPEVVARVLPAIEADLKVIRDEKNLQGLGKEAQGEAKRQVAPDAERTLKAIAALVGKAE